MTDQPKKRPRYKPTGKTKHRPASPKQVKAALRMWEISTEKAKA